MDGKKCMRDQNTSKKNGKRQKQYYKETKELSKIEFKERMEIVKTRVLEHRLSEKQIFHSTVVIPSPIPEPHLPSALIVSMSFPSRDELPRKRKRQINDRLCKIIAKLEKDKISFKKSNATLRKRVHRMKN